MRPVDADTTIARALDAAFILATTAFLPVAAIYAAEQARPGLMISIDSFPAWLDIVSFASGWEPAVAILAAGLGFAVLTLRVFGTVWAIVAVGLAMLLAVSAFTGMRREIGWSLGAFGVPSVSLALAATSILLTVFWWRHRGWNPNGVAALSGLIVVITVAALSGLAMPEAVFAPYWRSTARFSDTVIGEVVPSVLIVVLILVALVSRTPAAGLPERSTPIFVGFAITACAAIFVLSATAWFLGLAGMPSRYFDYPQTFERWWWPHASARLFLIGLAVALLFRPRLGGQAADPDIFD